MKHNIESSLKRFLKRKVKITMGFVVAFLITGTVGFGETITKPQIAVGKDIINKTYNEDLDINREIIEGQGIGMDSHSRNQGINDVTKYHQLNFYGKNLNINLKATKEQTGNITGALVLSGSRLTLGETNTEEVNIKINANNNYGFGIFNDGNTSGLTGNYGVGGDLSENSIIKGSQTAINGKRLLINVTSTNGIAAGIWSQTKTNVSHEGIESHKDKFEVAKIIVNSENTNIIANSMNGEAYGIVAFSNSQIEINGNLNIDVKGGEGKEVAALAIRGNSILSINKDENRTVKIDGDILFDHNTTEEGEKDSRINLNLSNKNSSFTGRIYSTKNFENLEYDKGNGMLLSLSNEAQWNNTGDSFVTDLTLNNGIINNTSVENDISVRTLKGTGGDINMVAEIGADGKAKSGKLAIDKVDNKDAKFNVNYSGEGNLEVSQEEAKDIFDDLAGKITVENGQFNANAKIEEGLISGEHTAEFVKGQGNEVVVKPNTVTNGSNSMVEGMRDLATINVLSWRQEMSSLNERMGELRDSTGSNGVWARVYGGKVENGSKYDNEYQTYQVGYDKKYPVENGDLFVGALVSYTDGKTDYNLGDGENYSVGAGVYATWLNRDGQFADVVLKQSRLHNKFDVRSKNGKLSQHGNYSNWGTSLSGQYGRRFDLDDKFFVEPSVQLTFGRVSSEDYTTSAGVKVEQDTAYTLVGDVGTAVGYKFSDKGNVYARASLVKEFKGDIDTKYSYGGKSEYTSEDLSDTWGEFGVGVNYRIKENVNMYVDIQRTEEATVENKWQANLGFRWEF